MRLGYFTMPVHPMHRDWAETLKEDREAIILADKLGFYDAFMGEHLTDACETITNSMMFHATLIPATTRIKLATGTTNLSHLHPVLVAAQAAMFDHLCEGRFILGVSPGALTSDAEALSALISKYLDCVVAATQEEVETFFSAMASRTRYGKSFVAPIKSVFHAKPMTIFAWASHIFKRRSRIRFRASGMKA